MVAPAGFLGCWSSGMVPAQPPSTPPIRSPIHCPLALPTRGRLTALRPRLHRHTELKPPFGPQAVAAIDLKRLREWRGRMWDSTLFDDVVAALGDVDLAKDVVAPVCASGTCAFRGGHSAMRSVTCLTSPHLLPPSLTHRLGGRHWGPLTKRVTVWAVAAMFTAA